MMNSKRMFYLMIAAVAILVAAIFGSAYLANGMIHKQAKILLDLKLKSQVLEAEKTSLVKAKQDINKYSELEKISKAIVPQDKDQALTVREIVKIASQSGIKLTSITFPASTLGGLAGTTPAQTGTSNLTQLIPVKGTIGLYVQKITITQDASTPVEYGKFITFLSRLEQNRRTAQVSSINLQPNAGNRNLLSFTLTLDEYIKP